MARTDRTMIIGVLFLLPVMLGLIGVGALLHVAVRVVAAEQEAEIDEAETRIEHDKRREAELLAAIRELERDRAETRDRLNEAQDQQAELDRLEEERARREEEREILERQLRELEARVGVKDEDREDLQEQRDEARAKLDRLTREIARLQDQIAQMDRSPNPGGNPPAEGRSRSELEAEIARLQQELEEQKKALGRAEADWDRLGQEPTDPNIRIERIRGSTNWQPPPNPLYVECDGQRVVLQPENESLSVRPDSADRDRFVQRARQRQYVLFLIRPDGFHSFDRYRHLVFENDVRYGYEPINQEGRVVYPE